MKLSYAKGDMLLFLKEYIRRQVFVYHRSINDLFVRLIWSEMIEVHCIIVVDA